MAAFKVIIIGSGLSGSCLANGLINNNIDVQVYERMKYERQRKGQDIRLGANALMGLRTNLSKETLQKVIDKFGRSGGRRDAAPALYDSQFRQLLDMSGVPNYPQSAPINRGIFRDIMAQEIEKVNRLHYDSHFETYKIIQDHGRERVQVHFKDGTTDVCDLLIGADGSHSNVNVRVGLDNISYVEDHVAFLCRSSLPTTRLLSLNPGLRSGAVGCMARGVTIFFNAYLPDKIDGQDTSAKEDFIVDDSISAFMLAFGFPKSMTPDGIFTASEEEKFQFLRDSMKDWSPVYSEAVELIKDEDIYVYVPRVADKPPADWRKKVSKSEEPELGHPRVWFVGDAMHAMLPGRGMGGNQALLDTARILPYIKNLAEEANKNNGLVSAEVVSSACDKYEKEMIPRGFSWVQKSGGRNVYMIDLDTYKARGIFFFVRVGITVLKLSYTILGLFGVKATTNNEAPELNPDAKTRASG